jgi:hypothetical protein
MDGYKAYKYYMAVRLHFTQAKYNVFVNRGHVKGTYQQFANRNDARLFERIARNYTNDKECIQYFASNFMYGNTNVVYDEELGRSNYKEYIRRKQSITRVFADDLGTMEHLGIHYEFSGNKIPDVLQLMMSKKITLETVSILNDMDGIVDRMKETALSLVLGDELMRIEKSKGFVKYDSYKVMSPYQQFLEDVKGTANG